MNLISGFNIVVLIISVLYPIIESADYCDDTVKEWGFHCESCSSMINCVQLPTSKWKKISIGKCDNTKDEYCNRKEKKCSKVRDCAIQKQVKFECNMEGSFPDPYDCSTYHVCAIQNNTVKGFDTNCTNPDMSYSSLTKECSLKKETNKFCKDRQFICNKTGDMAAWNENPQFYYICVEDNTKGAELALYPKLFVCQYGEYFNGQQCIKSNIKPTMIPPVTSTGSDGAPITSSTDNPTIAECKKDGLIKNPNDCTKYFICNKNLVKQEVNCPKNTHFDDQIKACAFGSKCT